MDSKHITLVDNVTYLHKEMEDKANHNYYIELWEQNKAI